MTPCYHSASPPPCDKGPHWVPIHPRKITVTTGAIYLSEKADVQSAARKRNSPKPNKCLAPTDSSLICGESVTDSCSNATEGIISQTSSSVKQLRTFSCACALFSRGFPHYCLYLRAGQLEKSGIARNASPPHVLSRRLPKNISKSPLTTPSLCGIILPFIKRWRHSPVG